MSQLVYGMTKPGDILAKLDRERTRLREAVASGTDSEIGDCTFNFAVTGYHIAEWVRGHNSSLKPAVDGFLRGITELQACRDICNASKHFQITRYVPDTADVYHSAPPPRASENDEDAHKRIKVLMSDGTKFELLSFADAVVSKWENFFQQHGL